MALEMDGHKTHCCEQMRMMVEDEKSVVFRKGEYGIRILDGGSSYLVISYCPWCGKNISRKAGKRKKQPIL